MAYHTKTTDQSGLYVFLGTHGTGKIPFSPMLFSLSPAWSAGVVLFSLSPAWSAGVDKLKLVTRMISFFIDVHRQCQIPVCYLTKESDDQAILAC